MTVATEGSTPSVAPHLARVVALPSEASAQDDVAYLSPALAHNLGLRLHLDILLHEGLQGAGGSECASVVHDHAAHGSDAHHSACSWHATTQRVMVQRYTPITNASGCTTSSDSATPSPASDASLTAVAVPGSEVVRVPVANALYLAELRRPQTGMLEQFAQIPAAEGDDAEGQPVHPHTGQNDGHAARAAAEGTGASLPGDEEEPEDEGLADLVVAALQDHFMTSTRFVAVGDTIAVAIPRASGMAAEILSVDARPCPPGPHAASPGAGAAELLYFRVTNALADVPGSVVFVPGTTNVVLHGRVSGALPVGLEGYLAGPPSRSCVAGAGDVADAGATHCAMELVTAAQVGVHHLLPIWQPLAQLLATVLHPSTSAVGVRCGAPSRARACVLGAVVLGSNAVCHRDACNSQLLAVDEGRTPPASQTFGVDDWCTWEREADRCRGSSCGSGLPPGVAELPRAEACRRSGEESAGSHLDGVPGICTVWSNSPAPAPCRPAE